MEKREFAFSDDTGDASLTVYQVFPGVQIAYCSVHMDRLEMNAGMQGRMIEIHHCLEGRIEQAFEDEFFYLMPGDVSVTMKTEMTKAYQFPLRHYHGITLGIHMDGISEDFRRLLREMNLQPQEVTDRLCAGKKCRMIREEKRMEHVFSPLYTVAESIREGCMKVKILELFLALSDLEGEKKQPAVCTLPGSQVRLAHQAAALLSAHMGEHITISALSRQLGVSDTALKTAFKGVYGVPVFSYMRMEKMQAAAQRLIHTEKPIAEISEEFGYANTGKFAAAFQDVLHETPKDYRRNHGKQGRQREIRSK